MNEDRSRTQCPVGARAGTDAHGLLQKVREKVETLVKLHLVKKMWVPLPSACAEQLGHPIIARLEALALYRRHFTLMQ